MKVTVIPIVADALGTIPKGVEDREIEKRNYSMVEIGLNTKKSPGDFRRLAVTQTLVKDYQLTLVWNTDKELLTRYLKAVCLC